MKAILVGQRKDLDKQDKLTFDSEPKEDSQNPVTSGGVYKKTSWICNPNLLDNWYFGNPVNQRGQKEYIATSGVMYTIDRFYIQNGHGKLTVGDGKVTFVTTEGTDYFISKIEKSFKGETLTVSMLLDSGELVSATGKNTVTTYGRVAKTDFDGGYLQIYQYTGISPYVGFCLGSTDTTKPIGIVAAKLELGSVQTLAHQEGEKWVLNEIPNYTDQLLRCQRFQYVPTIETTWSSIGMALPTTTEPIVVYVDVPVPLRANPTIIWSGKFTVLPVNGGSTNVTTIVLATTHSSQNKVGIKLTLEKTLTSNSILLRINGDATAKFILDANI